MSTKKAQKSKQVVTWSLPSASDSQMHIAYFYAQPRQPFKPTLQFAIHHPNAKKETALLNGHIYTMNIIAAIHEQWREDWQHPRNDGALAELLKVQDHGQYKSRSFSNVVRKQLQKTDHPFLSRFIESACRAAAQDITGWAQAIIQLAVTDYRQRTPIEERQKQYIPTLEEVYRVWAEQERKYQRAASSIIAFGRNANATIQQHGRREARWLLERLLSKKEIETVLVDVEKLLSKAPLVTGDALIADHPWERITRPDTADAPHIRAVRESRLMQRILDSSADFTLLGTLHHNELATLRTVLHTMKEAIVGYEEALLHVHEALDEARASTNELQALQQNLETFLNGKPRRYPSILEAVWSEEHQQHLRTTYETWLSWFQLNKDKPKSAEKFLDEYQERRSSEGMQTSMRQLTLRPLKPISLLGTAKPGVYRDFALLYERGSLRLTLAVMIYKPEQYVSWPATNTGEQRQKEERQYARRRATNPLYYVNYPLEPFAPPSTTSVIYVPLEYGDEYQLGFIQNAIAYQKRLQWQAQKQQTGVEPKQTNKKKTTKPYLPPAIFKSAKLLVDTTYKGTYTFRAHISAEFPPLNLAPQPKCVIGIHERDGMYYYAVLALDGKVCHVDRLPLAHYVDPRRGEQPNGNNYVFAIVHAILRQAQAWEAVIGIEHTMWKKAQVQLSRAHNRAVFRVPTRRVLVELTHKAQQNGYLSPIEVRGISPVRDCAVCQTRYANGSYDLKMADVVQCPNCRRWQSQQPSSVCIHCNTPWSSAESQEMQEQCFTCTICNSHTPAWYNTAIVVAQRTFIDLQRDYVQAQQRQSDTAAE